jgi:hypothetical protein
VDILDFLLGRPVHPFQTINFIQGSEQRAHSDFVHMTTEPMGYLIAAWIALEKTDSETAPFSITREATDSPMPPVRAILPEIPAGD